LWNSFSPLRYCGNIPSNNQIENTPKEPFKMKCFNRISSVALTVLALAAGSVSAQVMQHVPADSEVVAKVSNLKGLSDKIAALGQRFGIAPFFPPLADPLGSLEQDLKITKGIDANSDAAMVMLDPDKYGADVKQYGVILIPVTDYNTFLSNFSRPTDASDKPAPDNATAPTTQAAPTADAQGISTIAFPNAFDTAYVAKWGTYAAISKVKLAVATPGTGVTATDLAAKELKEKDFVVFINMPLVKAKALAALKDNRSKALDGFNQIMAKNPNNAAMRPMLQAIVASFMDDAQRLLEDSQAATYGISIEKTGIRTTILGEFIPTSPIGQGVAGIKNSDASMLAGMPADKYLMYGGVAWDPQAIGAIYDEIANPIRQELTTAGDSAQPMVKMLDLYRTAVTETEGQAMGWLAPSGTIAEGGLFKIVTVLTGDSAKMLDTQHSILDLQSDFAKTSNDPNMKMTTTYTANAKQLDGISFNEFKVQFDASAAGNMQARQMARMMRMMYGPDGMVGFTGVVDPKHLLTGIGAGDDVLTHSVDAIKANQDPLGSLDELKDVQANLPTQRLAAFYVPLDQIAMTGANYARQFGLPLNLQLAPHMAPIGATIATEQSAIRLDSFIPTQTVQSLIAAGMQAYMAAQGGGGGGL
jgi:hypothetical protein